MTTAGQDGPDLGAQVGHDPEKQLTIQSEMFLPSPFLEAQAILITPPGAEAARAAGSNMSF
jgi:hypothetical protein